MVSNRQKNPEVFPTTDPTIPKDPNKKNKMKSKFKRKKPETQSSDQPNTPKHCSKKSHWEKNKMDESTSGEPKTQEPKKLNLGIVWDHFTRLDCEHGENPRAACNYCGMDYACDPKVNGTKLMLTHIESQCKEYPLRQDENQTTTLGFEPKRETVDGETIGDLVAASFSVDACRKALAEMIIIDELPFKFVEGEGFKRFMCVVQPMWLTIPSRITIANDCKSIFVREKAALKNALRGQRICLTTDTWTSVQNLKYLCLTAHFIDCDWKLNKKILNFRLVPNQRGKTLGRVIENGGSISF